MKVVLLIAHHDPAEYSAVDDWKDLAISSNGVVMDSLASDSSDFSEVIKKTLKTLSLEGGCYSSSTTTTTTTTTTSTSTSHKVEEGEVNKTSARCVCYMDNDGRGEYKCDCGEIKKCEGDAEICESDCCTHECAGSNDCCYAVCGNTDEEMRDKNNKVIEDLSGLTKDGKDAILLFDQNRHVHKAIPLSAIDSDSLLRVRKIMAVNKPHGPKIVGFKPY